jgi:hypothetical protein
MKPLVRHVTAVFAATDVKSHSFSHSSILQARYPRLLKHCHIWLVLIEFLGISKGAKVEKGTTIPSRLTIALGNVDLKKLKNNG